MMGPAGRLRELLFPPRCIFCRDVLESDRGICQRCDMEIPRCGAVRTAGEFFSECIAPFYYEGAVRSAILRFKFSGKRGYAVALARRMAEEIDQHYRGRFDVIVWAPVSARRLRERGYDQAGLLAERVSEILDKPVTAAIKKVRHTRANSGIKGRAERAANILGAYEVRDGDTVRGKRVLLIDDIVTTGATFSECARALLMAGAEEVICAAAAAARKKN